MGTILRRDDLESGKDQADDSVCFVEFAVGSGDLRGTPKLRQHHAGRGRSVNLSHPLAKVHHQYLTEFPILGCRPATGDSLWCSPQESVERLGELSRFSGWRTTLLSPGCQWIRKI